MCSGWTGALRASLLRKYLTIKKRWVIAWTLGSFSPCLDWAQLSSSLRSLVLLQPPCMFVCRVTAMRLTVQRRAAGCLWCRQAGGRAEEGPQHPWQTVSHATQGTVIFRALGAHAGFTSVIREEWGPGSAHRLHGGERLLL